MDLAWDGMWATKIPSRLLVERQHFLFPFILLSGEVSEAV